MTKHLRLMFTFPALYAMAFLCIMSGALLQACGTTSVDCKDPVNASKTVCIPQDVGTAAATCSKQQLNVDLFAEVAKAVASSDPESALVALGETHGIGLVDCIALATYNAYTGKSSSQTIVATAVGSGGSAAAPPSTSQPDQKVLRLQAYLAKKHLI